MPRFVVIYGPSDQPKETWQPYGASVYENPQEATVVVKEQNTAARAADTKTIFMVKRLPDVVDYKARELAKGIELFEHQGAEHHMATFENGIISYYPLLQNAYDDRRTEMKLGRYLKGFVKSLDDNQISDICAKFGVACGDSTVQFARTRAEIREVYENGPRSCMSGNASQYNSDGVHPSEAYATEDIAVAFIRRDDGRITARTVCNMKDKKWVSIYGDSVRMSELLTAQGFTHDYNCLVGCRFLKIPVRDGSYALCYQDGDITVANLDDTYMIGSNTKGAYSNECGHVTDHAINCDYQTCGEDGDDDYCDDDDDDGYY